MTKDSGVTDVSTGKLIKLGDTDLTVANSAQDIRGRMVVDRYGEELGHVDALLIDDRENRVRFLQIASGGFLGIGEQTVLIPVDAITRLTDDQVVVDQTRKRVASAPAYDPDLVYDQDFYGGLYGYYGYAPYWGPGYVYPGYPYYL